MLSIESDNFGTLSDADIELLDQRDVVEGMYHEKVELMVLEDTPLIHSDVVGPLSDTDIELLDQADVVEAVSVDGSVLVDAIGAREE